MRREAYLVHFDILDPEDAVFLHQRGAVKVVLYAHGEPHSRLLFLSASLEVAAVVARKACLHSEFKLSRFRSR